jgi:hypothetical protein
VTFSILLFLKQFLVFLSVSGSNGLAWGSNVTYLNVDWPSVDLSG